MIAPLGPTRPSNRSNLLHDGKQEFAGEAFFTEVETFSTSHEAASGLVLQELGGCLLVNRRADWSRGWEATHDVPALPPQTQIRSRMQGEEIRQFDGYGTRPRIFSGAIRASLRCSCTRSVGFPHLPAGCSARSLPDSTRAARHLSSRNSVGARARATAGHACVQLSATRER